jgi:hypothetical protein
VKWSSWIFLDSAFHHLHASEKQENFFGKIKENEALTSFSSDYKYDTEIRSWDCSAKSILDFLVCKLCSFLSNKTKQNWKKETGNLNDTSGGLVLRSSTIGQGLVYLTSWQHNFLEINKFTTSHYSGTLNNFTFVKVWQNKRTIVCHLHVTHLLQCRKRPLLDLIIGPSDWRVTIELKLWRLAI